MSTHCSEALRKHEILIRFHTGFFGWVGKDVSYPDVWRAMLPGTLFPPKFCSLSSQLCLLGGKRLLMKFGQ